MRFTFDSEGTTGGQSTRRHLGGNDFVSSSVLSPEAFLASDAGTSPKLLGDVLSTAGRLERWATSSPRIAKWKATMPEVTAPKDLLGQLALRFGFESVWTVLALRGEDDRVSVPESAATLCRPSVIQFRTCKPTDSRHAQRQSRLQAIGLSQANNLGSSAHTFEDKRGALKQM